MSRIDKSRVCPIKELHPAVTNSEATAATRTIDKTSGFYRAAAAAAAAAAAPPNELPNSGEGQRTDNQLVSDLTAPNPSESPGTTTTTTPPPKSIMSSPLADVNALIGKFSYQSRFRSPKTNAKDASAAAVGGAEQAVVGESTMPKEAAQSQTTSKVTFDVAEIPKVTKIETTTTRHAKFGEGSSNSSSSSSSTPHVTPHSCNSLASQLTHQILVESRHEQHQQQQQNLKPILKRKDTQENIDSTNTNTGSGGGGVGGSGTSGTIPHLPPPILKKRDSLQEGSIALAAQTFENEELHNLGGCTKPILKNRQTGGWLSFDESIVESAVGGGAAATTTTAGDVHHLKPILKKKSWSIEEKVASSKSSTSQAGGRGELVKGILKTSDKSVSGTASAAATSTATTSSTAAAGLSSIATTTTSGTSSSIGGTTEHNTTSTTSTRVALRGILKTPSNQNRSASLSPSSSSSSIDSLPKVFACGDELSGGGGSEQPQQQQQQPTINADQLSSSVPSSPRCTKKSPPSLDDLSTSTTTNTTTTTTASSSEHSPDHCGSLSNTPVRSILKKKAIRIETRSGSEQSSSDSNDKLDSLDDQGDPGGIDDDADANCFNSSYSCLSMDTSNVVLRNKSLFSGTGAASGPRSVSCFVPSSALGGQDVLLSLKPEYPPKPKIVINSGSINERVAQLKQNGEESWRKRVSKSSADQEVLLASPEPSVVLRRPREKLTPSTATAAVAAAESPTTAQRGSSLINNRLSSLFESASNWKTRVMENDAKRFSASAKLTPTTPTASANNTEGVVLRGTPKRSGLRGSTLTESALKSVSSKLSDVFKGDRPNPLLAKRMAASRQQEVEAPKETEKFDVEKAIREKQTKESTEPTTVVILKPDDDSSFGAFYDINEKTLENLITNPSDNAPLHLMEFDKISPTKLLVDKTTRRVQGPARRAATRNLGKTESIVVDSYHQTTKTTKPAESVPAVTPKKDSYARPALAISALAGLASTEDIKLAASKVRSNTAASNSASNDAWRVLDLKNSIQAKMLILVKGKRRAHIRLVEPKWTSLCSHDAFILVTKDVIYAFVAQYANIIERAKCIEVAECLKNTKDLCHRTTINQLVLIDAHQEATRFRLMDVLEPMLKELDYNKVEHQAELEAKLTKTDLDAESLENDDCYEELMNYTNMIYRVVVPANERRGSHPTPQLEPIEQYCGRSPRHAMLKEEEVFVFDYGTEMYIWIGSIVSSALRKASVEAAKELWLAGYDYTDIEFAPLGLPSLKSDRRPDWAWFMRVNQNMEPMLFKDKFFNWPAFTLTRSKRKPTTTTPATPVEQKKAHQVVKKDLSSELNLFPVDVKVDMIDKPTPEPNCVLEFVSLGRGADDVIKDEDGLSVKITSLEKQAYFIDCNGNKIELSDTDRNFLYTSETYCIRWKYRLSRTSRRLQGGESKYGEKQCGRDRLCYFLWQGKDSKNTQRGATALNAVDKLREEGATQLMIENEKEFPVFLRIFNGSLVVQRGHRNDDTEGQKYRMFALKTIVPNEMFAVEQECTVNNLRSRVSFIFVHLKEAKVYLWHGCKSSEARRKATKTFLTDKLLMQKSNEFEFEHRHDYKLIEVEEGREDKDFFNIFSNNTSGKETLRRYSKCNLKREVYFSLLDDAREYNFTPRLFQLISSPDKGFEAIEITSPYHSSEDAIEYPVSQSDLYDVAKTRPTFFLFDNHCEVYLWESKFPFFLASDKIIESGDDGTKLQKMIDEEIQSEAVATTGSLQNIWLAERQCALETTLAYCDAKNLSEPPKAYVISAGLEPDCFRGLFPTWTYYDNVAQLHIEDGRKPGQQILVQEVLAQIRDMNTSTYSYEELSRHPLPEGINVLCIESYLDDTEFERIFKMNREDFYALPTWKQKQMKKEKSLF